INAAPKADSGAALTRLLDTLPDRKASVAGTWDKVRQDYELGKDDYKNFYTWNNLVLVGLGIGVAAPLANTHADQGIRNWYQGHVRGESTDEVSDLIDLVTVSWVAVPLSLEAVAVARRDHEDYAFDDGVFEWSNRSLRSMAVGWPAMLAVQAVLGSDRPQQGNSHWRPFHNLHGASGHTFMGAVPFLTAATMTDNPYWQCPLFLAS